MYITTGVLPSLENTLSPLSIIPHEFCLKQWQDKAEDGRCWLNDVIEPLGPRMDRDPANLECLMPEHFPQMNMN